MPFLKIYRVKKSYLPISHITYYAPCGALSADPVAAAWYGFTIYPVGLRLSDRGAAAWYGFTIYPVGLLPGMASPFTLWGKLKGATPVLKELRPVVRYEHYG